VVSRRSDEYKLLRQRTAQHALTFIAAPALGDTPDFNARHLSFCQHTFPVIALVHHPVTPTIRASKTNYALVGQRKIGVTFQTWNEEFARLFFSQRSSKK
jgi:hypothetical protein